MNIKEQLDRDGYVIIKNFFSPTRINDIKISVMDIFNTQFEHFGYPVFSGYNEDEIFKNNMIRLFNEHEEVFKNCGKLIQTGSILLYHLAIDIDLIEILMEFLDFPNMCTRPVLYFNHPKLAKSEEYYKSPLHQDWPSMESSLNSLVVWVPLVDVNEDNGSIIIYPGSHKLGVLPFETKGGFANVKEPDIKPIQPELNVGDIVIFSTMLVHKSGDIKNDTIRWSCHFRYTDMLEQNFIERGYPNPYIYSPITKR